MGLLKGLVSIIAGAGASYPNVAESRQVGGCTVDKGKDGRWQVRGGKISVGFDRCPTEQELAEACGAATEWSIQDS